MITNMKLHTQSADEHMHIFTPNAGLIAVSMLRNYYHEDALIYFVVGYFSTQFLLFYKVI